MRVLIQLHFLFSAARISGGPSASDLSSLALALRISHKQPSGAAASSFAPAQGGVGVLPISLFFLPHPGHSSCPQLWTFAPVFWAIFKGMNDVLMVLTITLSARSFGVAHTHLAPGFGLAFFTMKNDATRTVSSCSVNGTIGTGRRFNLVTMSPKLPQNQPSDCNGPVTALRTLQP
jgi:hypothetical protein